MSWRLASNSWSAIIAALLLGGGVYFLLTPSSSENPASDLIKLPDEIDTAFTSAVTATERHYSGPKACAECHQAIYQSFAQTSHASTSSVAEADVLQSIFPTNPHRVVLSPDSIHVDLEIRPHGMFQTAVAISGQSQFDHTERLDVVIGSGKMGYTFGYWKGEHLYQLPVGYVSITKEWRNSPGFPDDLAVFARPIDARCIECHATFAQAAPDHPNRFDRDSVIYGVSCESCHGPAQQHIEHHKSHPESETAQFVMNPAAMPRARQIDVCSRCHAGGELRDLLKKPFTYHLGEPLDEYLQIKSAADVAAQGPHSNDQFKRLSLSRCFQKSDQLVCTTCHDPHTFERNDTALFSRRCQTCHSADECGKSAEFGDLIRANCIDCHMQKSGMELHEIGFFSESTASGATLMRDHRIRVPKGTGNEINAFLASQAKERLKQLQVEFEVDSSGDVQRLRWPAGLANRELVLLKTFDKLQELDLSGNTLDDAAWEIVLQLQKLRQLSLSNTRLSTQNVRQLTKLFRLQQLDLSACPQVTDDVLSELESLTVLKSLDLQGTSVSSAGIERLRKKRPGCDIRF